MKNRSIFIILFLSLLIGVFTLTDYGESWDELSLQKYADKSIQTYVTWPQQGVVQITQEDLGNYGPAYVMATELIVRLLSPVLPISFPDIRHLFYFFTYIAGVWAFYSLATRWLSQMAATGATLLFMTQPIFWGHAFMNPKDTPFMSLFILSLALGFKMIDSIQTDSFDSLPLSAKRILAPLSALWLVSVFSLFIFTDSFLALIANLVHSAQAGETNIISLIASNIHTVPAEVYIQRYFLFFLKGRTAYFLLSTSLLLFAYYRLQPSHEVFHVLNISVFPAILLGISTSTRILGPFAGLIIAYFAIRAKGKQAIPTLVIYTVISMIAMYLTWPYLWSDPIGRFFESLETMSLYPWRGSVLFNGVTYPSTDLPYTYLPTLFGIQLTEPVWALFIAGLVVAGSRLREKRQLLELVTLWFIIPFLLFIFMRVALYDNFRQIFFVMPPIFLMAGVAFDKIKNVHWQAAIVSLCLIPGLIGIFQLHPYEYIYYNRFIGGVDGAQKKFSLDYWVISYRQAAEYVNSVAPPNAAIWVEGPSQLFATFAREDLKIYSSHEAERAEYYEYVIATTRYNLDQAGYLDAKIVFEIIRDGALLAVIKQP